MTEGTTLTGGVAADRLLSFIEKIEILEEERSAIAAEIRDVCTQAKHAGFDVKIIKQLVKLRAQETDEREAYDTAMLIYRQAIGV